MAEMLHQASDDQLALAICFGAVALCGLTMYFSHHVGRLTGHIRMHETGGEKVATFAQAPRTAVVPTVAHDRAA